jgi:uncharacterized protein (UPF0261 family)
MSPVYVVGTYDTKSRELSYVRDLLSSAGVSTVSVDVGTKGEASRADVGPVEVARYHPEGTAAVFSGDRGASISAMAAAFERFLQGRPDIEGVIGLGGSGGTAMITPALQALPIGVPKLMVSTVAGGDVGPYVGASDIAMLYSVTDIAGLNRISRRVLANAAHAMAGMVANRAPADEDDRPAVGLTMFGVTTECVSNVTSRLEDRYDCLVFHATGTGGRSMEKLETSGLVDGVLDLTTTEIADHVVGGVLSAGGGRLDATARSRVPYVGSCGALDMVNFWAIDTVPERYRKRQLHVHNPNVTLMRTTVEECRSIGHWIAQKLNACDGPVRFLIPEGGVSALDRPGEAFYDEEADAALFEEIESGVIATPDRIVERVASHINEPAFADAAVKAFADVTARTR